MSIPLCSGCPCEHIIGLRSDGKDVSNCAMSVAYRCSLVRPVSFCKCNEHQEHVSLTSVQDKGGQDAVIAPSLLLNWQLMLCYLVLQRIMGVKYSFPTNLHISRECLDMMSKIFVGNPANRISIAGIKSHPWFTKNLPDELKVCTAC